MSEPLHAPRSSRWVTVGLLAALLAIFAVSLLVAKPAPEGEESFGGTDAAATTMVEESGYESWFAPIFEPGSGEVESGLFALQAAIGGAALGFFLGRLGSRSKTESTSPDTGELSSSAEAEQG